MDCYSFIGIQGSGKGTQAEMLSKFLNYKHINIGDLFRYHITHQTDIGLEVQRIIQNGDLVPDNLVFNLINLSFDGGFKGIVFDGFPRTMPQAEYLVKHYNLLKVFYLELSKLKAIERISARRVCGVCQENYNVITKPPEIKDICDICGSELIIRIDDQEEAIEKRFNQFYIQTLPLKIHFENNKLLTVINADKSVEDIFEQIKSKLKL